MEKIITYLAENSVVLIGAATTIAEILIIIINTRRRLKSRPGASKSVKQSKFKTVLWVINPINVFRKP